MRLKDKKENILMEKPEYFADFINGCTYQGEQILKKENIRERKQVYTVNDQENPSSWSVIRDVVMETEVDEGLESTIVLIGVENQSNIHYSMPLKILKSDVANYMEQLERIIISHKKKKDLKSGNEYLSGFSVNDKIVPVFTYCVYWGEDEWDGPRCLKDMLDLENVPKEVCELIGDYPLNLIEVNKFEHPEYFKTDLRIVFEFLKRRGDLDSMKKYVMEHEKELEHLQEDAFDLICELSKIKGLKEIKNKFKNEKGEIEMCRAFDEWARIERDAGRNEGKIEGGVFFLKKVGFSKEDIAKVCEISMIEVENILATISA